MTPQPASDLRHNIWSLVFSRLGQSKLYGFWLAANAAFDRDNRAKRELKNIIAKKDAGKPHDFDRPSSRDEALDRLERQAGPHARQMLEEFLEQVAKAEAEYLDQTDTATSFKDAASRRR